MQFTTTFFTFLFLPLSIILYYLIYLFKNKKLNNLYLVLASLAFYSFSGIHNTIYLFIFINIIYFMGKIIDKYKNNNIIFFTVIIILILSYYKYGIIVYNLFNNINIVQLTFSNIAIPLGLSFIVFESLSYLFDIYRKQSSSGSYLDVMLFLLFFPKITSGPIVLWRDFSPQITKRNHSLDLFYSGTEKIIIGFAKKCIIADTLGLTLSNIISNMDNGIDRQTAILGVIIYTLQIYYDFSGYSDIAIGVSNLFGFNFKENFNFPYTSNSVSEFWRRWHISLGTWFKNYIYIPLGGNRKKVYINLMIVFIITGIWHGSTFNFILWGVLHGFFIVLERYLKNQNVQFRIPRLIKWFLTINFIMFTWIIFMLPEFKQIIQYFRYLFLGNEDVYFTYEYYLTNKLLFTIIIAFIGSIIGKFKITDYFKKISSNEIVFTFKVICYFIIFFIAILYMVNTTYKPFLYFQF